MRKQLMDYLPGVLQGVLEFCCLADTEQTALNALYEAVDSTLCNQFVADASEAGIVRYEGVYKLLPKATDSLEERRFRVRCAMMEKRPYTFASLKSKLEALCGAENVSVVLDAPAQTITIKVALVGKSNMESAGKLVERFVPCNILVNLILMYNTHEIVGRYTHAQLAARTHEQIRSEVF